MRDGEENKAQVLARLKRAEGQLRAVTRMVEREDDCVRKALDRAFYDLLACAMRKQFTGLGLDSPRARSELAHMTELLTRYG
jgi:CsoR family transcriptional regulator, copper-sensing transcriptional repressor